MRQGDVLADKVQADKLSVAKAGNFFGKARHCPDEFRRFYRECPGAAFQNNFVVKARLSSFRQNAFHIQPLFVKRPRIFARANFAQCKIFLVSFPRATDARFLF